MVIAAIFIAAAAVAAAVVAWMLMPRSSSAKTVQEILHPADEK